MYEDYLESFRSRTKIRGKTLSERLNFVLNRWDKVVADSAGDESLYRRGFSDVHLNYARKVRKLIEQVSDDDAPEALREFTSKTADIFEVSGAAVPHGILDGMGYIISELELITHEQ